MNLVDQFSTDGYAIVPELFSKDEISVFLDHYMAIRQEELPGDDGPIDRSSHDPLRQYPRIMQPHRWDQKSMDFLLDPRIDHWISEFMGASPVAVQTMVYFKPPGARGQALHQDNFYLHAKPGTCIGAWLALDDCDLENGCMMVVPGSHKLPLLCMVQADTTVSFTDVTVEVPEGMEAVPALMKAGDVMFFTGEVIHGSGPNQSSDRFRRALIGHYVSHVSEEVGKYYRPCYHMNGELAELRIGEGEDRCGKFVDGHLELVTNGHWSNPGGPH